jgi:hypothetical protein
MIEKPRDLPAGKCRTQKQERHPSPELPRVLHELMNQLTIMNFSCSKFSYRGGTSDRSFDRNRHRQNGEDDCRYDRVG